MQRDAHADQASHMSQWMFPEGESADQGYSYLSSSPATGCQQGLYSCLFCIVSADLRPGTFDVVIICDHLCHIGHNPSPLRP